MDNIGRLFGQVAAEGGVTASRAKLAVYVMGLAEAGRPVSDVASALRVAPETVKRLSRAFLIDFVDFVPYRRLREKGLECPAPKCALDRVAA